MSPGDICWLDLGQTNTSRPAKRRPVIVVQAPALLASTLKTTTVVTLTSNTGLSGFPGNVFLPSTATGLPRDSVANVTALATVDREELSDPIATAPGYLLADIKAGLRLVLDL